MLLRVRSQVVRSQDLFTIWGWELEDALHNLHGAPTLKYQDNPHRCNLCLAEIIILGCWLCQGRLCPMQKDLGDLPSESMQTVWCWPPEKPTQDLVEFLKDVKF